MKAKLIVKTKRVYIWICPKCEVEHQELARPEKGLLMCPNCTQVATISRIDYVQEKYND